MERVGVGVRAEGSEVAAMAVTVGVVTVSAGAAMARGGWQALELQVPAARMA